VIHLYENGANIHVCPVEHPQQAKVRVSLSWLRKCPREFPGSDGEPVPEAPADTGSGIGKDHTDNPAVLTAGTDQGTVTDKPHSHTDSEDPAESPERTAQDRASLSGVWAGRLRKNPKPRSDHRG